jgi:hypothetical protein
MDITEIRRKNARYLSTTVGGINAFSEKTGKSQSQISSLIGKSPIKNIGNKIACEIEKAFHKPKGWLDNVHPELYGEIDDNNEELTGTANETEDLTDEAIEFARLWQNLPSDQRAVLSGTAQAFVDSTKKQPQKKQPKGTVDFLEKKQG